MRNLTEELNWVTNLWRADEPEVDRDDHWEQWDLAPFVDHVAWLYKIDCGGDELYTEEIVKRFTEEQLREMYLKWQLEKE